MLCCLEEGPHTSQRCEVQATVTERGVVVIARGPPFSGLLFSFGIELARGYVLFLTDTAHFAGGDEHRGQGTTVVGLRQGFLKAIAVVPVTT